MPLKPPTGCKPSADECCGNTRKGGFTSSNGDVFSPQQVPKNFVAVDPLQKVNHFFVGLVEHPT